MRFSVALAHIGSGAESCAAVAAAFFRRHNCQDEERRLEEIRQAVPATHDRAVIQSSVLMVQAAVRVIQNLKDITRCEERIAQLTKSHPDFAVFDSLPGAGEALVPRLIAALGTQRERFQSAAEIQAVADPFRFHDGVGGPLVERLP